MPCAFSSSPQTYLQSSLQVFLTFLILNFAAAATGVVGEGEGRDGVKRPKRFFFPDQSVFVCFLF